MNNDERLTRIESKVDKLTDVVVQLAAHNERLIAVEEKVRVHEDRIELAHEKANRNSRFTWIIPIYLSGLMSFIVYFANRMITGG